jgi:CHAT domain
MRYEDLTVEVADAGVDRQDGARRGRFKVRVLASPAGEMRPEEAVPVEYDDKDLQQRLGRLESRELDAAGLVEFGRLLAAMLLPPSAPDGKTTVREYFARGLARLDADTGLRLRLRLPPALSVVPWEYVYVDRTGGGGMDGFLALDPRTPIVRHELLGSPVDAPALHGDIRVLAALAEATGLPELDLDAEQRLLDEALDELPGLHVETCRDPGFAALQARLADSGVFHFAGHGDFRREMGAAPGTYTGTGFLALGDERVDATDLALLLRGQGLRLAVLSGCNTGRRDGCSVWSGIAPALVAAGIPAVVANQYKIQDRCALAFGRQFYQALAGGLPVERAVAAGRIAAYRADPAGRDWGVPVLYLRAGNGEIFAGAADPQARERNRAAAEAEVQLRVREIKAGGLVLGADLEHMLEGKLGVDIQGAGTVLGRLVGAQVGDQRGGSVKVKMDVDTVGDGGTVVGYRGSFGFSPPSPPKAKPPPESAHRGLESAAPPSMASPMAAGAEPAPEPSSSASDRTGASIRSDIDVDHVSGGQVIGTQHVHEGPETTTSVGQMSGGSVVGSQHYHGPFTIIQGEAAPPAAPEKPLVEERVRLDAALPEAAVVGEPFDLVIQVMQPDAPTLSLPDLPQTVSAEGSIFRAEDEDVVHYRVEVTSPDFDVVPPHYVLGLRPRTNSRQVTFQLTPKRVGRRRLLVSAYQVEDNALAAQTRLSIEVAVAVAPG